ncbi:MAG: glycosyltransferase, partial [Stenotrophomonas bentonitica]
ADPLQQARHDLQQHHRQAIMPKAQGDLFAPPVTAAPEPPV